MDKFTLVYEFNKESPLITYEATKEYENQNYSKAAELFKIAINKFPYHPTAFFLYAVTLANLNDFDKAKELITKGDNLLNNQKTSEYYHKLVEKLHLQQLGIDTEAILDDNINPKSDIEEIASDGLNDFNFIDDNPDDSQSFEKSDSAPIVTETLAEIYASQGNFSEALEIYKKLKELKPEFNEKFDNRIREINIAIENKKLNRFGN